MCRHRSIAHPIFFAPMRLMPKSSGVVKKNVVHTESQLPATSTEVC